MTIFTKNAATKPTTEENIAAQGSIPMAAKSDEASAKGFGVRSYIYQFYDTVSVPQNAFTPNPQSLLSSNRRRRRLVCLFRTFTLVSLMLLVTGAITIFIGYMWPKEPVSVLLRKSQMGVDSEGNLLIGANVFNDILYDRMHYWKVSGLFIFACGGVLLSTSLLVPLCSKVCGSRALDSDLNTPLEAPVKLFLEQASDQDPPKKDGIFPLPSADAKVPFKETITEVQPKTPEVKTIDAADLIDGKQLQ